MFLGGRAEDRLSHFDLGHILIENRIICCMLSCLSSTGSFLVIIMVNTPPTTMKTLRTQYNMHMINNYANKLWQKLLFNIYTSQSRCMSFWRAIFFFDSFFLGASSSAVGLATTCSFSLRITSICEGLLMYAKM